MLGRQFDGEILGHDPRIQPSDVVWEALWDAPGDHAGIDAWYKDRLQADGWKVFQERKDLIPADALKFLQENVAHPSAIDFTTDEIEFGKGKWRLSIEHKTSFDKGRPRHAQFWMRLTWDYWHKLDPAAW
jgi:hypothetical protein